MDRKEKNLFGFTLIELIITIFIITILAAASAPLFRGMIEDNLGRNAMGNLRVMSTAAAMYYNDTGDTNLHEYPDLANINTMYTLRIQSDPNFSYTGSQTGSNFAFTATRTSGAYNGTIIQIDNNDTLGGTWPYLP